MYPVSQAYKDEINNKVRNPSYINIMFGILNDIAPFHSSPVDNGHLSYSDIEAFDLGVSIYNTYATIEHNRFLLFGNRPLPLDSNPSYQGYVGSDLCASETAIWSTRPDIIIDFGVTLEFSGLTFFFDILYKDYPKVMLLKGFIDGVQSYSALLNPDATIFVHSDTFTCDEMQITFVEHTMPDRRARITSLLYGLVETVTDDTVGSAFSSYEIDMLSSKLPKSDFNFTILDINETYNPENPSGKWEALEKKQPVFTSIGYELDDGTIEWIPWCNTYSTGDITIEGNKKTTKINIKTVGLIHHLNMVYDNGVYTGTPVSLKTLAEEVVDFSGYGGAILVDSELDGITTITPLPPDACNNTLQNLANAGLSILGLTRGGIITLTKRTTVVEDFTLDLTNQLTIPKVTKYPVLRNLTITYGNIVLGTVLEDLCDPMDVDTLGEVTLILNHDCAKPDSYVVTGSVIVNSVEYFAYKTVVKVTGTGTVKVQGYKVNINRVQYTKICNEKGEDLQIENILINTLEHAMLYADWVQSVMDKRNEYEAENRGYPELYPVDNINYTSGYNQDFPVTVIKQDLTYNGAIKGNTKLLIGGDE